MSPTYPNPTACPSKAPTDRIESIHTVYFGHEDAREKIFFASIGKRGFRPGTSTLGENYSATLKHITRAVKELQKYTKQGKHEEEDHASAGSQCL